MIRAILRFLLGDPTELAGSRSQALRGLLTAEPIEAQASVAEQLARCDREIEEIRNRPDVVAGEAPAWLVALGINDWEKEKELILKWEAEQK